MSDDTEKMIKKLVLNFWKTTFGIERFLYVDYWKLKFSTMLGATLKPISKINIPEVPPPPPKKIDVQITVVDNWSKTMEYFFDRVAHIRWDIEFKKLERGYYGCVDC